MELDNGVVRGSYERGSAGWVNEWACKVDKWFLWIVYERPMDGILIKVKEKNP